MKLFSLQIPPLKVKRKWHQEDPANTKTMHHRDSMAFSPAAAEQPTKSRAANFTTPFSEFDSKFGRYADPLYSKHESTPRLSGLVQDSVYVDPHVLATPIITDTNGDGVRAELVVPVSYYFDPYVYGDPRNLEKLNGLEAEELADYTAGGVVIIDLSTGEVIGQKLLSLTRVIDTQPGYLLATPTCVRMRPEDGPVIIIGSATGDLHMLSAGTLEEEPGFPISLDSITAQVAVGDLFNTGSLDIIVGDYSGILYCIDRTGRRVWEKELDNRVTSSVRLADVEGDGILEVFLSTRNAAIWVLNAQTGKERSPYPVYLNNIVETPVLVIHLSVTRQQAEKQAERQVNGTLAMVVPTEGALYVVEAATGCVHTVWSSKHYFYEVVSGDIDPYSPGLELLGIGLDGTVACYATRPTNKGVGQEAWSLEATGQSIFSHKKNSFYFELPYANSSQEIVGQSFKLPLIIFTNTYRVDQEFSLKVAIGQAHVLYEEKIKVRQRATELTLTVDTPPSPTHSFMTVSLCNQHMQCRTGSFNVRFNLHFESYLKWCLCLPFLSLCAVLLWVHRNAGLQSSLPTVNARKEL